LGVDVMAEQPIRPSASLAIRVDRDKTGEDRRLKLLAQALLSLAVSLAAGRRAGSLLGIRPRRRLVLAGKKGQPSQALPLSQRMNLVRGAGNGRSGDERQRTAA
jgi:hypothetical protein